MTDLFNNCVQNECECNAENNYGKLRCIGWVLFIFSIFFTFGLGLTLGVVFAEMILVALPSLIASTVILLILVIVTAIFKICIRNS